MFVIVRCATDALNPNPGPVIKQPTLPFPHFMARAQIGSVELACEVPAGFNAIDYFDRPITVSGISPEMYQAMLTRYLGWGLQLPLQQGQPQALSTDTMFFVASEDARPVQVHEKTPEFRILPFMHFEGVSLVRANTHSIETLLHYWPDSFCHQTPL